jgi:hypothetical protein
MNTMALDTVIVELSDEYTPAEQLHGWAERSPEVD